MVESRDVHETRVEGSGDEGIVSDGRRNKGGLRPRTGDHGRDQVGRKRVNGWTPRRDTAPDPPDRPSSLTDPGDGRGECVTTTATRTFLSLAHLP